MKLETLWSLRLGFSSKKSDEIKKLGVDKFLKKSFAAPSDIADPAFLKDSPKNTRELREYRQKMKDANMDQAASLKQLYSPNIEFKAWWLERMATSEYPLQEKMNVFWHNHFVSTIKSVKIPYWIFQQYRTINEHALGNYRDLTKAMMYSNAMLKYLDNNQNRKGKINENLGRELLELFTLGEGHYSENDVKNVAKSLAGLTIGNEKGVYRPNLMVNSEKTIFGKSGNFKIDEVVDLIFEQENTPYFITEKMLKWFVYDTPPKELVQTYGKKMRELDFEMKPFLTHVFTTEFNKNTAGSQIKNPLVFSLQILHELEFEPQSYKLLVRFLKNQNMDLFDQPNVKGWDGGRAWLSSQTFLGRNEFVDAVTRTTRRKRSEEMMDETMKHPPKLDLFAGKKSKEVIAIINEQLITIPNENLTADMGELLKYDFDPGAENANDALMRLFTFAVKSPEFQLI